MGLAAFEGAKNAVHEAVNHYGALADALDGNIRALRDNESLTGGYGITGHFQSLLAEFGREWNHAMDKLLAEERAFATFLRGFAEQLEQTQHSYRLSDARHAENFENISRFTGDR